MKFVPSCISKTSVPQTWDKPRIQGIHPEPVMQCTVKKSKTTTTSKPVTCSLYEARTSKHIANSPENIRKIQEDMAKINPLYGFTYMVNPDTMHTDYVKTKLGSSAPLGSVLSYQLALTEGNFDVFCDMASIDKFQCTQDCKIEANAPNFPAGNFPQPILSDNLPQTSLLYIKNMSLSMEEAHKQEEATREQSNCQQWWDVRKNKFTASKFGELYRKKPNSNLKKFAEQKQKDTGMNKEKLPEAIKYGINNEAKAVERYEQYMLNSGKEIKVFCSGFVVRPDIPYLGCSPDRKVFDRDAHPHVGVMEVKCSHKYQNITPQVAAGLDDKLFCLELANGKPQIKKTHRYYYQVQGQMALCGVKWCDFVLYTNKGLHIERVPFDDTVWDPLQQKLEVLYMTKFLPILTEQNAQQN